MIATDRPFVVPECPRRDDAAPIRRRKMEVTVRTVRLALAAIAIAASTDARAHDGAGPHTHGSADPRPCAESPAATAPGDREDAKTPVRGDDRRDEEPGTRGESRPVTR